MNFKEKLEKTLKNHQISVENEKLNKFEKFYNNLINVNKIHNLTSITDENDVIYKHFLDSILPICELNEDMKILDIGCGAGFPSLPLKIMNENLNITAIDSVGKKIDFVQNSAEMLEISHNFNTIHTRIEDLAHNLDYREKFDIVLSRAVAPLNIILEYSAPFLKMQGYILAYKGSNYEEEIKSSNNALKELNCKIDKILEFNLEEIDTTRYIIKIKKIGDISTKYPRKQNKPRTNPL